MHAFTVCTVQLFSVLAEIKLQQIMHCYYRHQGNCFFGWCTVSRITLLRSYRWIFMKIMEGLCLGTRNSLLDSEVELGIWCAFFNIAKVTALHVNSGIIRWGKSGYYRARIVVGECQLTSAGNPNIWWPLTSTCMASLGRGLLIQSAC